MAKKFKLSNAKEIRKSLGSIANMVINDEIDPKKATTFTYVCNGILQSIRVDEQEKKIEQLEGIVNEIKGSAEND